MFMTKFVYEYLWGRFGYSIELVNDQGSHFLNRLIRDLTTHYAVVHKKSTSYYPQANGLAESTNKILQNILKKIELIGMTSSTAHSRHIGRCSRPITNPPLFTWLTVLR